MTCTNTNVPNRCDTPKPLVSGGKVPPVFGGAAAAMLTVIVSLTFAAPPLAGDKTVEGRGLPTGDFNCVNH
jgi:hypothetical protein